MGISSGRFEDGLALFHRSQFFEAHEVWEEAWRQADGRERILLHGLIQIAAGFHKMQCGRPGPMASLLAKGAAKLVPIAADSLDPPLRPFLHEVESWRQAAERRASGRTTTLDPASPPRLRAPRPRPFRRRIDTDIVINATARRVWSVLTSFDDYPAWNPFLTKVAGLAAPGARLSVTARPDGGRGMTFAPRVLRAQTGRELRWRGRLVIPGLFTGEHVFTIAPLEKTRVRFGQREIFSGLLLPLFLASFWNSTRSGFDQMNRALKRRAEA